MNLLRKRIDCFIHKITVGRVLQYHVRGKYKVRIDSWYKGKQIIYFEGQLKDFRELNWSVKKEVYKQRVFVISAEDDILVIQLYKEKPELQVLIFNAISIAKSKIGVK